MSEKIKIIELLKKTKRILGARELDEEYTDCIIKKCEKFGVDIICKALDDWIDKNRFMPRPSELIGECKFLKDQELNRKGCENLLKNEKKEECEYQNDNECEFSRRQCNKKISAEDAHYSRLRFEKVFCKWHVDRFMAEQNPKDLKNFLAMTANYRRAEKLGIIPDNFEDIGQYLREIQKITHGQHGNSRTEEMQGGYDATSLCFGTMVAGGGLSEG